MIISEFFMDLKYAIKHRNDPPKPPMPPLPKLIGNLYVKVFQNNDDTLKIVVTPGGFASEIIKPFLDDPTIKILRNLAYQSVLDDKKRREQNWDKLIRRTVKMFDFVVEL